MLVVEVELLTGRYAATAHDDRRRAEWPPHPARFFSALVAALHDRAPVDDRERAALLWLEQQPAPAMNVDLLVDEVTGRRDVHDVWVPVNDVSLAGDPWPLVSALDAKTPKARSAAQKKLSAYLARAMTPPDAPTAAEVATATALLPERRTQQMRAFPVAVPASATLAFLWEADPPDDVRAALDWLCARVSRLGHSSSLVRCAVAEWAPAATLVPDEAGDRVLRWVAPGQLARLEAAFAHHQAVESRVLPARPQRYGPPATPSSVDLPRSVFGADWIIYERYAGARLLSSRGADLGRALRAAILEANGSEAPLPPVLSGHRNDGKPGESPHVAFVACPFVGHPHADGSVQGCAIVLPRDTPEENRRALLRLIGTWEQRTAREGVVHLAADGLPPVQLVRVTVSDKRALSPARWNAASARFITATPIALDRHPGNLRSNTAHVAYRASVEAQRSVADACERIGLPRPTCVEISLTPLLAGAQPVRDFRPWPDRPGRPRRARVHADIRFDRAVRGPVLLGAGRYFGLGLCLPVREDGPQ